MDAGITCEGRGRGVAVVSYSPEGALERFPLAGRPADDVVFSVGVRNLMADFGPLKAVTVTRRETGRVVLAIEAPPEVFEAAATHILTPKSEQARA